MTGTRGVTIKLIEAHLGHAAVRAFGRVYPWTWIAYTTTTRGNDLLATGRDRATRDEALADVHMLFGARPDVEVSIVEDGAEPWPIRRAVTA